MITQYQSVTWPERLNSWELTRMSQAVRDNTEWRAVYDDGMGPIWAPREAWMMLVQANQCMGRGPVCSRHAQDPAMFSRQNLSCPFVYLRHAVVANRISTTVIIRSSVAYQGIS